MWSVCRAFALCPGCRSPMWEIGVWLRHRRRAGTGANTEILLEDHEGKLSPVRDHGQHLITEPLAGQGNHRGLALPAGRGACLVIGAAVHLVASVNRGPGVLGRPLGAPRAYWFTHLVTVARATPGTCPALASVRTCRAAFTVCHTISSCVGGGATSDHRSFSCLRPITGQTKCHLHSAPITNT